MNDLSYAKPPQQNRRTLKIVVACIAITMIFGAAIYWGYPFARYKWQEYAARRQLIACMQYVAPEELIVWNELDDQPTTAEAEPGTRTVHRAPLPPPWVELNVPTVPNPAYAALLFLHERQTPSGKKILVAVEYGPSGSLADDEFYLTHIDPKTMKFNTRSAVVNGRSIRGQAVKIYAGRPDPSDPTRFSIRVQTATESRIIDGQVSEMYGEAFLSLTWRE